MASFASSATTCGARKHAWTNFIEINPTMKVSKHRFECSRGLELARNIISNQLVHQNNIFSPIFGAGGVPLEMNETDPERTGVLLGWLGWSQSEF